MSTEDPHGPGGRPVPSAPRPPESGRDLKAKPPMPAPDENDVPVPHPVPHPPPPPEQGR